MNRLLLLEFVVALEEFIDDLPTSLEECLEDPVRFFEYGMNPFESLIEELAKPRIEDGDKIRFICPACGSDISIQNVSINIQKEKE